jgi:hypothetical protein
VLNSFQPKNVKCKDLSIDEIKDISGRFELNFDKKTALELFPNIVRLLPSLQIAELLATTRLIGMECPGLNSIYSELDIIFNESVGEPQFLTYKVSNCDKRFSLVSIEVNGPGMAGTLKAFIRPPSVEQGDFVTMRSYVNEDEFSDQKAIVIGGSRGLGEVTAKLLAAGGAEVFITYFRGKKEAQKIVDDIRSHGGKASCFALDIYSSPIKSDDENFDLTSQDSSYNFLYFFSSPFIFSASKGDFSIELFDKFCDFYVRGFLRLIQPLLSKKKLKNIFYPSTIAIDELPNNMGEYAAAKMAGETLCNFLENTIKGIKIHKPRLPRMATDQTVSLLPVSNNNPVPILLKEIRILRDL